MLNHNFITACFNHVSSYKRYFAFLLIVLFGCSLTTFGQDTPKRGFNPAGSYAMSDIETIDTTGGDMMLHIPIAALPPGRGGLGAKLSLVYNSKLWDSVVGYDYDLGKQTPPCTAPAQWDVYYPCLNQDRNATLIQQNQLQGSADGGWKYAYNYWVQMVYRPTYTAPELQPQCPFNGLGYGPGDYSAQYLFKVRVHYPDGSVHEFSPLPFQTASNGSTVQVLSDADGWTNIAPDGYQILCGSQPTWVVNTMTYASNDGTYAKLVVNRNLDHTSTTYRYDALYNTWTLYLADGTKVDGNLKNQCLNLNTGQPMDSYAEEQITDRNGNYILIKQGVPNYNGNGDKADQIIDQFGRSIDIEHVNNTLDKIHVTGFMGTTANQLTWVVNWASVWVKKSYRAASGGDGLPYVVPIGYNVQNVSFAAVASIQLPAQSGGLSYQFGYNGTFDANSAEDTNGWGELSSITLPSGAVASYSYFQNLNDGDSVFASDITSNFPATKTLTYKQENDCDAADCTTSNSNATVTETWQYSLNQVKYTTAGNPIHYSTITNPDGGVTTEYFDLYTGGPSLVYKTVNPDGTVIDRIWDSNPIIDHQHAAFNSILSTEITSVPDLTGTPSLASIRTYTYDFNGNRTSVGEYDWVNYGSITSTQQTISNPNFALTRLTDVPSSFTPVRTTVNTYFNQANSVTDPNLYKKTTSPRWKQALESTEVYIGKIIAGTSRPVSHSDFVYDDNSTRGNLVQQNSWVIPSGSTNSTGTVSVSHTYDPQCGNLLSTTDANANVSTFTYDQNNLYVVQTDVAVGTNVHQTATMVHDYYTGLVTSATDPNGVITNTTYDAFGRPTLVVNALGSTVEKRASTEYSDIARRVIVRSDLYTAGDGLLVSIQHYDPLGRIRLTRTLESTALVNGVDPKYDERQGIKAQTRYFAGDGSNPNPDYHYSYTLTSNPYREDTSALATGAMGWTRMRARIRPDSSATTYQNAKVSESETFNGTAMPGPVWGTNTNSSGKVTTVSYSNQTLVTDQTGKQRTSLTNGVGELTQVIEDPSGLGYVTSYTYDVLIDLVGVYQCGNVNPCSPATAGVQSRTFAYDSLKRLSSATNPESGTISYTYDSNGNLLTRLDARGIYAHNTYDALNRVTRRWYNSSATSTLTGGYTGSTTVSDTPDTYFYYDTTAAIQHAPSGFNASNALGRLVAVETDRGLATTTRTGRYYSYDALGRTTSATSELNGTYYNNSATYNLAGIASETYPSVPGHADRRTINYTYDGAGRAQLITSGATSYAAGASTSNITYSPHGGIVSETYGTTGPYPLIHSFKYNNRLQPTEIMLGTSVAAASALDLTYTYDTNGHDNNGNVLSATFPVGTINSFQQTFTYDGVNRLNYAQEVDISGANTALAWHQTFGYDPFGNRSIISDGSAGATASATSLTPATGTVDITGSEQSTVVQGDPVCTLYYEDGGCAQWEPSYNFVYDFGSVSVTVNGFTATASYGPSSTFSNVASSLATALSASNSPVTAQVTSATSTDAIITITARQSGSSSDYTLSTSVTYDQNDFTDQSFSAIASDITMTGGADLNTESVGTPDHTFNLSNQVAQHKYDAAGNVSYDGNHHYKYDGENHLQCVDYVASQVITRSYPPQHISPHCGNTYNYDGEGHRIRSTANNLLMIYGISGQLLAEFDNTSGSLQKEYMYGVSGLLATVVPGSNADLTKVQYLTPDHLGSARIIVDGYGHYVSRHDYKPFGEQIPVSGQDSGYRSSISEYGGIDAERLKFTSKERDVETGLDYFYARYYSSSLARFTIPDPALSSGKLDRPQSWNRYTYCLGNPFFYSDPTGLEWRTNDKSGRLRWYYENDDRTGTTEYTDTEYQVGGADGYRVFLNPNGPDLRYYGKDQDKYQGWSIERVTPIDVSAPTPILDQTDYLIGSFEWESIKCGVGAVGTVSMLASVVIDGVEDALDARNVPVSAYDVGIFKDLKDRSDPNDGLDIHHLPQAQQAEQVIPNYDRQTGTAIALPRGEHQNIPNARGTYNGSPEELVRNDLQNLGTRTNAPASSQKQIGDLIERAYGIKP